MPSTTPNRDYPYPDPTDPADVPGALQDLAQAINDDVQNNLVPEQGERIRGYMRAGSTQTITDNVVTPINYQIEFRDDDNMIDVISDPTLITINTAGYYTVWGMLAIPCDLSWDRVRMNIRQNGVSMITGTQLFQSAAQDFFHFSLSTSFACAVGDQLTFTFEQNGSSNMILGTVREFMAWRVRA